MWRREILTLLDRHSAIYLNDLLPESRTRAQYQQLCRVVAGLEDTGEIETVYYLTRWNHPGHKVLVKPGHSIEDRNVAKLNNNERLQTERAS
jgi:cystathionine beta-lyase/cystathionine gamma-synthase